MAHRTGRPLVDDSELFARRLAAWIDQFEPLLEAIDALRRLGNEDDAIDALLHVKPVREARLSWELWVALLESSDVDANDRLAGVLGEDVIGWCRWVLWGPASADVIPITRDVQ